MFWLIDFLIGFTAMVAGSAMFTMAMIGMWYGVDHAAWTFRRGSLAREAQRDLARARVRARRTELEPLS
ncbi:MAG: hypothetical protein AAGC53_10810 [Actinomycetota bacterium]